MITNRTFQKLLQQSRPAVMASLAGTVMGISTLPALAQMPLVGAASDRAPAQVEEPRRLPSSNGNSIRPLLSPLALTAGELAPAQQPGPDSTQVQKQLEMLYQQNGRPMPQMVPGGAAVPPQNQLRLNNGPQAAPANAPVQQPVANQPAANQPAAVAQQRPAPAPNGATQAGFFDKMKSVFKTPSGKNPPVDPGMNYPTYREGQNQNANLNQNAPAGQNPRPVVRAGQPAQNAANPRQNIQANAPAAAPAKVPGLFAQPAAANPIQQQPQQQVGRALVPPAPQGSADRMVVAPAPAANQPRVASQSLPEIYVPQNPAAGKAPAAPPQIPGIVNQPIQTANALPKLELGAPSSTNALQMVPVAPAAAPVAMVRQAPPADPFANLFPEDGPEQSAAAGPRLPAPSANEIQKPYTGLSLDPNGFDTARQPAPGTPLQVGVASPAGQGVIQVSPGEQRGIVPPTPPMNAPNAGLGNRELPRLELAPANDTPRLAPALNPLENRLINANTPAAQAPSAGALSRMEMIASRPGTGMKGFCPVRLRDQRELVAANPGIAVTFNGVKYEFATEESRADFLKDPARYVPAANGTDIVHLALTGESQPGKLDHAVWYKGRLYLFADVETMETFVASPGVHALAN